MNFDLSTRFSYGTVCLPKNTSLKNQVSKLSLAIKPIGAIHTAMRRKFDAPHQPASLATDVNIIELNPGHNFEQALKDLDGFDRVWLVWWFHKNKNWKPMVLPPRGPEHKRGVFATRSPHRPNPIGMSAVKLLKIDGRKIYVGDVDLIDGTPILDVKPYIPQIDAFPEAKAGWVDSLDKVTSDRFKVTYSKIATEQIKFLQTKFNLSFWQRAEEILSKDPTPHRTRRISSYRPDGFRIGCGPWRMFFSVTQNTIIINRIGAGYSKSALKATNSDQILDQAAQLAFVERFSKY